MKKIKILSKKRRMSAVLAFLISSFLLSVPAYAADLINENFEDAVEAGTPAGWLNNSVDWSTTYANSPSHSMLFGAGGDYLITSLLTNPATMTYYMRATAGASSFIIEWSDAQTPGGTWTALAESPTTTDYNSTFKQETFDLSSYSNIYIKFRRDGTKSYYLDDVVVTEASAGNSAPNAPGVGPTAGQTGQFQDNGTTVIAVGGEATSTTVVLKGMVSDPDGGDTVKLQIELREKGTAFNDVVTSSASAFVASGTTQTITVSGLTEGVTYHWRARTIDSNAATSDWAIFNGVDGDHFVVFRTPAGNSAPSTPSDLSPAADSWIGNNTPTLSFTAADADSDNVKFFIQVSSFSNFSELAVYYVSAFAAPGAKSFTVGQAAGTGQYITGAESQTLPDDDGYYWRVWLEDSQGAFSSTATANAGGIAFKIDKTTPTNVGLSTPVNNAENVSASVTLEAITAYDSVSGVSQYYFEMDEVTTFNSGALVNSGWQAGTSWSPTLSDNSTYYWRVKAKDAAGNTSLSCGHTADTAGYGKFITEVVVSTSNLLPSATGQWHFGFEAAGAVLDNPACWEEIGAAGSIDNYGFTSSHEGSRVCRLDNLIDSYSAREIWSATCTVTAGQSYTVDVWAYIPALAGSIGDVKFRLGIRWYSAAGSFLSESLCPDQTLSAYDTWEKLTYLGVIAPANAVGGRLLVAALETNNLDYDPYVDDASFHVTGNVAPNAPSLSSPADNAATNDTSPVFTWSFSDPNSGDTQGAYQWVADDDPAFGSINYNSNKTASATASHTTTMAEGTWYWKVKTWDAGDLDGAYSSTRTIAIDLTKPNAVTDLKAVSSGSNIALSWTPGTDAFTGVSHQALYRATFSITNQYAADVTMLSNSLAPTAGSYTDPAVNFGTTYYYVVTAVDEAPNESDISNCPSATPATIGDSRLQRTNYYAEPLFTPGKNTFDGTWMPYMNQRLIELINAAQSKCYVVIYNLTDDDPSGNSITDSLIARKTALGAANVKVITDRKNRGTDAIKALEAAGITVKDDGTDYPEMHNKFAVIDGKYVWTGSANWTSGGGFDRQDSDTIIIYDEAVALAYENQFLDMYNDGKFHVASTRNGSKEVSGNLVEYYFTGSEAIKNETFGLRSLVRNAVESCIGSIFTFVQISSESLEDELMAVRSGGKVVRLVFDRDQLATSSPYYDMDELGMNVRPGGNSNITHNKLMVIDQEIVATGSMNWTQVAGGPSSNPNDENHIFIHDPILARQYVRYLMRLHDGALDEDTAESPTADTTPPASVSNVSAFGSGSAQITVEFDASTDPGFSRYYIFISTLQTYANAMAVKQKFIDTNQYHFGDAVDNDGDKAVDEEVFDGTDTDGDGLIDEDINMMPEVVVKTRGEGTVQVMLTTAFHGQGLDNNTTYWVCVVQTDKWGNESPASFADASEPTTGDSFYGPVSPKVPSFNTAPECVVASPAGWNGGAITLSATAWDNDSAAPVDEVRAVEFYYSTVSASGPWAYAGTTYLDTPAPSTGTYNFTWNSASYITLDSSVWIRARAKDKNMHEYSAWSVSSDFSVDNQAPPAPSPDDGIPASGSNWTNDSNPPMSWAAVTDSGSGLHATEPYLIRYNNDDALAHATTSYATNLSDGSHIFYVAAKDAVGNISTYGYHSVNVDVTPSSATVITSPLSVEFDRITIVWNSVIDATSGVLHYNIYRALSEILSVAALTPIAQTANTSYTDEGLAEGLYFYAVCAVDKAGNEASVSNSPSATALAPPVTASVWHIPSSTTTVSGSHTYRYPAYDVHKGTKVYFYSRSDNSLTQNGLTLYWGTDGVNYSSVAGMYDSPDGSYELWYATVTISQSGGTTFYYYLAADYAAGADRTYLYDLYSNGVSSTSAFVADAESKPFKLYIINTPPPMPTLTSPNGGEELYAGNNSTITWSTVTDADGDTVYYNIAYSVDDGVSWNGITGNAQGSSYVWTVENTPSENARMRIRAYDGRDYSAFDESDSTFTINAVTTDHIVISEVCVGYTGAAIEYLELYNPTTYPWTLNGRMAMKLTTGGSKALQTKTLTFVNDAIPSKGFFLIASQASIGGTAADCTYGGTLLSGYDGAQILYDSAIIDRLAWGTTNAGNIPDCTETTRVSELQDVDSNWAMERKAYPNSTASSMAPGGADNNKGNAVDTDNNAADFVIHYDTNSFTPQNSLSPLEPPANLTAHTLSAGGVSPAKGTTATSFTFSVTYTDEENDRPTIAKVYIDDDSGHPMGSTDEIYDDGSIHTYTTFLSQGIHEYYFYFSDGKYYTRYPSIGVLTGPNVGPNLDSIEIIRPGTPSDSENIFPGAVIFDCLLSGGGAGDVSGNSSFEARLKYSLNGGAYQTLAMAQDSVTEEGNYFTVSKAFVAGDYVNFYFEGRDSDSADWATYGGETSYFSVGLLPAWHYPSTVLKSTSAAPSSYRYPLIPLQTQTVDIFTGCESSTASVSLYYAANAVPAMNADGTPAAGTVKIELQKEFGVDAAGDDREGNYFTTRVSSTPIPAQNDGDIVYYFIKTHLTGLPTTYLISDGSSPEGSHMTSAVPALKTQCFSYIVGEVDLIEAFHIASQPDSPDKALFMREVEGVEDNNYFPIHTAHSDMTETINFYFGKNSDASDYSGTADDLRATLYFRNSASNAESYIDDEFPRETAFSFYSTIGSTDYWHCSVVLPSDDPIRYRRDDIVEYYIRLEKAGMETTVLYPGPNNNAYPDKDNNSATIASSLFDKTVAYNNSAQPKFWFQIKNYPPVMQYAIFPANYAKNINLNDSGNNLQFEWTPAVDYDGDSISEYLFQISRDVNFADGKIISSGTVPTAEYTATNLYDGSIYYWRVKARDSYGGGEWGDWCNNNSHWQFSSLGAARADWISMTYGPTGTENVMTDQGDGIRYSDIRNSDAVRLTFSFQPSPHSDVSQARIYYEISSLQFDPIVTIADSTDTSKHSFYFRADDTENGNTKGGFGVMDPSGHNAGGTVTVRITIPADVHQKTAEGSYFWVKPCALTEGATVWVTEQARRYAINENADAVIIGRGLKNKEWPTNPSVTIEQGDSNDIFYASDYTPFWHNPSAPLMPGYLLKNYLTPQNNINRVGVNERRLNTSGSYLTEPIPDAAGNPDIYYGEDPGIYMRTAYVDLGSGALAGAGSSVVMSYNNFTSVIPVPLSYEGITLSTAMSPYELKYSFAKALESSNVKNMPENAEVKYYFKLSQGASGTSYLCKNGDGAQVVVNDEGSARAHAFTYHVLQDDYTRPFVWKTPAPYAVSSDSETLCGRSVGYVMVRVGLADTFDGLITPPGSTTKIGPFRTWPGGWADAVTEGHNEYLLGDAINHAPFNSTGVGDYSEASDGYFGNNVWAFNTSSKTIADSGVVSNASDNITYHDNKRWAHQTLCYFAYMRWQPSSSVADAAFGQIDVAGFRNRSGSTNRQLFEIANVDGALSHQNVAGDETDPASTISGVVEMAPVVSGVNGNTEWYARIPVPPDVEDVPHLYYRIWACNGDNDPQARFNERGGGGSTTPGPNTAKTGVNAGTLIDDPYLAVWPSGAPNLGRAGGRYRDHDYGWVTRSLYAGRVAKPAQVRITAIVNYRNTSRQVTAFMKIDEDTGRPSGILSIQVNTPKMPE